jgi:hypothetical protein
VAARLLSLRGSSIELHQVHARIQGRDLLRIAVEHQCRSSPAEDLFAQASLALLAPAGVVARRVHVGVEAVLAGVVLASINIFGGFAVTARMLAMYKKKER